MKKDLKEVKQMCIAIRERYGLSTIDMGKICGFGINTWRNYENGEQASVSNYHIIYLIQNPVSFLKLLEYAKNQLSSSSYKKAKKKAEELLKSMNEHLEAEAKKYYTLLPNDSDQAI